MQTPAPDVTVVIVNYETRDDTVACVTSVLAHLGGVDHDHLRVDTAEVREHRADARDGVGSGLVVHDDDGDVGGRGLHGRFSKRLSRRMPVLRAARGRGLAS